MVQELVQADCGVSFDSEALKRWRLPNDIVLSPPSPSHPAFRGSSRGSGESSVGLSGQPSLASLRSHDSDARDVQEKINDQLKSARLWRLLEIIPTRYPVYENDRWVKKMG